MSLYKKTRKSGNFSCTRLDIFQIDNPFKNLLGNGGGDDAPIIGSLRLLYDDERQILRFICGKKANEGGYVFPDGYPPVHVRLCRTCLTHKM